VLGAVVDVLSRDVEAATAASASGPGGRAAAVVALAAFASGSPIDRLSILRAEVDALDPDDRAALDRICATILSRRIDSLRAAERTCRLCEPHACGHPQRCPVTHAANAYRSAGSR
jgi:hypothetical protein